MSIFVTNEDYNIIDNALFYIYGSSCLIDYHSFKISQTMFENKSNIQYIKVLENNINTRFTENDNLRFHIL